MVGLYLNPPDKAVVLCVDEKSQIQALDRTQPGAADEEGARGHDDPRLQAPRHHHALRRAERAATGTVIGECRPRHRHQEFLKFLRQIDREAPERHCRSHLILDNYATHKHPDVKSWLDKHPRFHLHFTPTSSSWLNLVERWFREITDKAIRRGVFPSVPDLISAIENYLNAHNDDPKPFVWVASAESILEKVSRGRVVPRGNHQLKLNQCTSTDIRVLPKDL